MDRFELRAVMDWTGRRYWTVVDLEAAPGLFRVVEAHGPVGDDSARREANRLNSLEPGQNWFPYEAAIE